MAESLCCYLSTCWFTCDQKKRQGKARKYCCLSNGDAWEDPSDSRCYERLSLWPKSVPNIQVQLVVRNHFCVAPFFFFFFHCMKSCKLKMAHSLSLDHAVCSPANAPCSEQHILQCVFSLLLIVSNVKVSFASPEKLFSNMGDISAKKIVRYPTLICCFVISYLCTWLLSHVLS